MDKYNGFLFAHLSQSDYCFNLFTSEADKSHFSLYYTLSDIVQVPKFYGV